MRSSTWPSAPWDVASRWSCGLGDKVSRPSRGGIRLFSSGLFVWQGTNGEMQADGKETVKYVCSSLGLQSAKVPVADSWAAESDRQSERERETPFKPGGSIG